MKINPKVKLNTKQVIDGRTMSVPINDAMREVAAQRSTARSYGADRERVLRANPALRPVADAQQTFDGLAPGIRLAAIKKQLRAARPAEAALARKLGGRSAANPGPRGPRTIGSVAQPPRSGGIVR